MDITNKIDNIISEAREVRTFSFKNSMDNQKFMKALKKMGIKFNQYSKYGTTVDFDKLAFPDKGRVHDMVKDYGLESTMDSITGKKV